MALTETDTGELLDENGAHKGWAKGREPKPAPQPEPSTATEPAADVATVEPPKQTRTRAK